MPSRNIVRQDTPDNYYHVYVRGASKAKIFHDNTDKDYLLYLLEHHLSIKAVTNSLGYTYPHFRKRIELLSYCLMDNHFHLLFYQLEQGSLSKLMKSIMIAYTTYFNRRYRRSGSPFESRFKASVIDRDPYLLHVSRYIHLNPRSWKSFKYSSLRHIKRASEPEWLQTERLLSQHTNREAYLEFVADYEENKRLLDDLKYRLANL